MSDRRAGGVPKKIRRQAEATLLSPRVRDGLGLPPEPFPWEGKWAFRERVLMAAGWERLRKPMWKSPDGDKMDHLDAWALYLQTTTLKPVYRTDGSVAENAVEVVPPVPSDT